MFIRKECIKIISIFLKLKKLCVYMCWVLVSFSWVQIVGPAKSKPSFDSQLQCFQMRNLFRWNTCVLLMAITKIVEDDDQDIIYSVDFVILVKHHQRTRIVTTNSSSSELLSFWMFVKLKDFYMSINLNLFLNSDEREIMIPISATILFQDP